MLRYSTRNTSSSEASRLRAFIGLTCKVDWRYVYSLDVTRGTSTRVMPQQVAHLHMYMSDFCLTPLCIAQPPPSLPPSISSLPLPPSFCLAISLPLCACMCVCVSVCRGSLFSSWPTSRPPDSCWLSWTTLCMS